jgi:hypothetical protein
MLEQEEYIEQAYLFRVLRERLVENMPLQELLSQTKEEILATTKLPMALDFMLGELKHRGVFGAAMARLPHYFSPFQTYVIQEAENERGRFDMRVALEILRHEAEYRAQAPAPQGLFFFQFETICRNRLRYDPGLLAISNDPVFDANWREWILAVRRQIGLVDLADLLLARSEFYANRRALRGQPTPDKPILFGEKEGKIAAANRRKDPLFLFAALQRHLGYPAVPRVKPYDPTPQLIPQMLRRLERLEVRLKLLEDEQREGIDITKFYTPPPGAVPPPKPPSG